MYVESLGTQTGDLMQSMLNFVDLAGSEKLSSHYSAKDDDNYSSNDLRSLDPKLIRDRINEGKNINKSLFFLT